MNNLSKIREKLETVVGCGLFMTPRQMENAVKEALHLLTEIEREDADKTTEIAALKFYRQEQEDRHKRECLDIILKHTNQQTEEWQDISTAPRDGTQIIGYDDGDIFLIHYKEGAEWTIWADGNRARMCDPEYWLPLPKPPCQLMDGS